MMVRAYALRLPLASDEVFLGINDFSEMMAASSNQRVGEMESAWFESCVSQRAVRLQTPSRGEGG